MEAFGLLIHGFPVLLTFKTLSLMMVGLVLGIFVGVLPAWVDRTALQFCCPDVLDGPDLGHRDAVVHLLGRAVRRRHHVDPVQHPGRSWSVATTFDGYPMAAG